LNFEKEPKIDREKLADLRERLIAAQVPPVIGQIVYYISYGTPGGEYAANFRAAIITQVDDDKDPLSAVGLCVLNPTGMFFNQHVPSGLESGHWTWSSTTVGAGW
jgi:hypothetical protein